jgi:hypothetical protein
MEHSATAYQQSLEADKQSAYFATKHGKKNQPTERYQCSTLN